MPNCDLCGNETELYLTLIEGTELNVCKKCSKFGKVLKKIKTEHEIKKEIKEEKEKIKLPEKEIIQIIVPNYHKLIKTAREKLGLKQEEFAKKINEKINLIHLIETGKFEPNIALARKLEKFLKIKLIEEHEEVRTRKTKTKTDKFTIGDFIKVK